MKSKSDKNHPLQTNEVVLVADVKAIIQQAKSQVYSAVNSAMVQAYWLLGRRIVEEEQDGNKRAEYGKYVIATLSQELTEEFGRGFSVRSLREFRQFYTTFPEFWDSLRPELRSTNEAEFTIRRTLSAESFSCSQDQSKNPSVLEFLNLPSQSSFTESQLETAIIDNLHHFLLEMGKGYAFVERQKLIRTETRDYFVDLVFYNYILKCFVLIDLKTERITHQDVGQMDMYIRMYDETIKGSDDNPTVGIVLCSETDHDIARYSILKGNEQIFATKYKLYLPTVEELTAEIEREKELIRLQLEQEGE